MADPTKRRLLRWLATCGLILLGATIGVIPVAIADTTIQIPETVPWWAWLLGSAGPIGVSGFIAYSTAKRQARKTALEEYRILHDAKSKELKECREGRIADGIRINQLEENEDASKQVQFRLESQVYGLRSFLQVTAFKYDIPLADVERYLGRFEDRRKSHEDLATD
ncbi:hypothetical protein [Sphingomonas sp.]|jgi:hypothetical protein|uniref:hypothetical protein n=1 Tax=Sphingomonas sp. TaxID=28214 RepID=UPI0035688907